MLFSSHFKVSRKPADDWFDTILNADTRLFVDPFLVFRDRSMQWRKTHQKLIKHFHRAFILIAENSNPQSLSYRKALHVLHFAEPQEFCLGFTAKGTAGLGSGDGFAELIAKAIEAAIARGLREPKHFEELGILNEGIGRDRISDITLNILKPELISYTQQIAQRLGVPMHVHRVQAASFDTNRLRWETQDVTVPTNPFTAGPLLLVPRRFLRELPTLNAVDWWDDNYNQQLRDDLNYEIITKVSKADIVAAARERPESVRAWIERKEGEPAEAYDLDRDSSGVYQWDQATAQFTAKNPLQLSSPQSYDQFLSTIDSVIGQFRLFVEDQGGWKLLWNDDGKAKDEHAVQLLFRGVVAHYCAANNISLDPEVNLGRGPVDFKFSTGSQFQALLEVKKEDNGKFWNGIESQLPSYLKSAGNLKRAWFLIVRYRRNRASDQRIRELPTRVSQINKDKSLSIRHVVVDARQPVSASKIRRR